MPAVDLMKGKDLFILVENGLLRQINFIKQKAGRQSYLFQTRVGSVCTVILLTPLAL